MSASITDVMVEALHGLGITRESFEATVKAAVADNLPKPKARWIGITEASERLSCHASTLRAAIKDGLLPASRVFKSIRISENDLEAYLQSRKISS